ncbi:T-box [Ancylostoma ceylanicum]|uniref:T-box n=1 Tax=Ancylostoma ceylanicum TaxID=53326 RepID=A0A0D6LAA0_9BILA|nr:T-box [Ancylostoma ceylanicum]
MFPTVKVSISNIDIEGLYYIFLDVIPVDNKRYRYIYNKSAWLTAGKAEPAPKNRLYLHPDSPYTGEQLLKQVVSFEKAKLTNNEIDKAGHLILNSMHKYQPRIHIVRRNKGQHLDHNKVNLADEVHRTFVFPETQFMAVTAYQNQLITKLKIEKNPRMFPTVKVSISNIDIEGLYYIFLDVIPVDNKSTVYILFLKEVFPKKMPEWHQKVMFSAFSALPFAQC